MATRQRTPGVNRPSYAGRKSDATASAYATELVDSCPDIIFRLRVRPTVRVDYINPASERMWGYRPGEVIGQGLEFLQSILVGDDEQVDIAEVAAGRRFYPVVTRRYRRKDGSLFWGEVHNVPLYDETGALFAQMGTIRDVTEREAALRSARANELQLTRITEWLPDLMLKLDQSGTFTEHVKTGSKQPAEVFVGRNLFELLPEQDRVLARHTLTGAYAGAPGSFRSEIEIFGVRLVCEFRIVPTGEGYLIAMIRDITSEPARQRVPDVRQEATAPERARPVAFHNPYNLTFREFAVLELLVRGAPDKAIAHELGIALSTVNNHVSSILAKMHAASRTEAGIRAITEQMVAARSDIGINTYAST